MLRALASLPVIGSFFRSSSPWGGCLSRREACRFSNFPVLPRRRGGLIKRATKGRKYVELVRQRAREYERRETRLKRKVRDKNYSSNALLLPVEFPPFFPSFSFASFFFPPRTLTRNLVKKLRATRGVAMEAHEGHNVRRQQRGLPKLNFSLSSSSLPLRPTIPPYISLS